MNENRLVLPLDFLQGKPLEKSGLAGKIAIVY